MAGYPVQQEVLDPFALKSLPSKNQLSTWKDELTSGQNISGQWKYIETSFGRFDVNTINTLLKFHVAKGIKSAVEQEVNWFSRSYNKPRTVSQHPSASVISDFQEILYSSRYDDICEPIGMAATELARLCVNRWLSDEHICWLMKKLTDSQNHTYCIYLNGSLNSDPKTFRRFSRSEQQMPSAFLFAINVRCGQSGKTFFGTDAFPGCHWSLCHVDMPRKRIMYGDSLAWPAPEGLLDQVNKFIKAASNDADDVSNYSFSMGHDPTNRCSQTGSHRCAQSCTQFYPLQTCSNICGVIVMVVSAIACYDLDFFNHILAPHTQEIRNLPHVFLQKPSQFSKYLRLVVAAWITTNSVNIAYVVPALWQEFEEDIRNISVVDAKEHRMDNMQKFSNGSESRSSANADDESGERVLSSNHAKDNHQQKPTKKVMSRNEKKHKCPNCDASFTIKYSLKRHMLTKHPHATNDLNQVTSDGNCICHDCGCKFYRITDLRQHLTRSHNFIFKMETITFDNMSGK